MLEYTYEIMPLPEPGRSRIVIRGPSCGSFDVETNDAESIAIVVVLELERARKIGMNEKSAQVLDILGVDVFGGDLRWQGD